MTPTSTSSDNFKETLKQQADIVRIVGDYVKLKKAGAQNFSGLCPFHAEKTPSFSVHATRQFFHCFGCGQSGDVFSFVQKIENVTFPEAIRAVAQKMGVALPKQTFSTEAEAKDARLRTVLLEIHDRAGAFFQEILRRPEGARAREYLSGRGLNEETIKQFRIGFAPDSGFVLRDRLKGDFTEEVMRESGLFSWKDSSQPSAISHQEGPPALAAGRADKNDTARPNSRSLDSAAREDRALEEDSEGETLKPEARSLKPASMYSKFRNRIMFPIANESGRVIAFTGRTLSTDEKAGPKYLNS